MQHTLSSLNRELHLRYLFNVSEVVILAGSYNISHINFPCNLFLLALNYQIGIIIIIINCTINHVNLVQYTCKYCHMIWVCSLGKHVVAKIYNLMTKIFTISGQPRSCITGRREF